MASAVVRRTSGSGVCRCGSADRQGPTRVTGSPAACSAISTYTGPGVPLTAMVTAFSSTPASRSAWSTRAAHLTYGRTAASWSSSWNAPVPIRSRAVPPAMRTTGAAAEAASSTPVRVLVRAGPLPTAQMPGRPEARA